MASVPPPPQPEKIKVKFTKLNVCTHDKDPKLLINLLRAIGELPEEFAANILKEMQLRVSFYNDLTMLRSVFTAVTKQVLQDHPDGTGLNEEMKVMWDMGIHKPMDTNEHEELLNKLQALFDNIKENMKENMGKSNLPEDEE
jgi:hypothetical protein